MPSFHRRHSHRHEIKKIKRQIQTYMLLTAFVVCAIVLTCRAVYAHSGDGGHHNGARQLLDSEDDDNDGYYIDSLSEFPNISFSLEQIKDGWWIVFFIGMFYCFVGIAIVCDDYFVPVIEVIVDKLQLTEDVAGATFLAAGGSAPELFTSFLGTFLAKSDVGFGTIVGSAVFNILVIIGSCAIFTSGKLKIPWYPFARDLTFYIICLVVLASFIGGTSRHQMYWYESLVLLCLYGLYVFIMTQNERLKAWVYRYLVPAAKDGTKLLKRDHQNGTGYGTEIAMQEQDQQAKSSLYTTLHQNERDAFDNNSEQRITDDEDGDNESAEGLSLQWPDTWGKRIAYIFTIPLTLPVYCTLVDVSQSKYSHWWPWTFVGSLVWLGALSYLMVWWAVVVAYAWNVPQEIMGLVFLAAGTSTPELFSCIIVAKKGQASMAVAASIGSNIFDILVGLPLPWFLFSVIQGEPGQLKIDVEAHGLFLSIIVLIAIMTGFLVIILVNKWTLTHCMGYSMLLMYAFFIAQDLSRHYFLDIQF